MFILSYGITHRHYELYSTRALAEKRRDRLIREEGKRKFEIDIRDISNLIDSGHYINDDD